MHIANNNNKGKKDSDIDTSSSMQQALHRLREVAAKNEAYKEKARAKAPVVHLDPKMLEDNEFASKSQYTSMFAFDDSDRFPEIGMMKERIAESKKNISRVAEDAAYVPKAPAKKTDNTAKYGMSKRSAEIIAEILSSPEFSDESSKKKKQSASRRAKARADAVASPQSARRNRKSPANKDLATRTQNIEAEIPSDIVYKKSISSKAETIDDMFSDAITNIIEDTTAFDIVDEIPAEVYDIASRNALNTDESYIPYDKQRQYDVSTTPNQEEPAFCPPHPSYRDSFASTQQPSEQALYTEPQQARRSQQYGDDIPIDSVRAYPTNVPSQEQELLTYADEYPAANHG